MVIHSRRRFLRHAATAASAACVGPRVLAATGASMDSTTRGAEAMEEALALAREDRPRVRGPPRQPRTDGRRSARRPRTAGRRRSVGRDVPAPTLRSSAGRPSDRPESVARGARPGRPRRRLDRLLRPPGGGAAVEGSPRRVGAAPLARRDRGRFPWSHSDGPRGAKPRRAGDACAPAGARGRARILGRDLRGAPGVGRGRREPNAARGDPAGVVASGRATDPHRQHHRSPRSARPVRAVRGRGKHGGRIRRCVGVSLAT